MYKIILIILIFFKITLKIDSVIFQISRRDSNSLE